MTGEPRLLIALAVLAAAALALALLVIDPRSPKVLQCLIGASAGLFNVEIGKIHVFTILCVTLAIIDRRSVIPNRAGRRGLLIVATAILCTSVLFGGSFVSDKNLALQLLILAACGAFIAGRDAVARNRVLWGLFMIGVLGGAWAIGQKIGAIPYTPFVDTSGSRVTGIYHEPDWLGLYTALSLILLFALPFGTRAAWRLPLGAVLIVALALSGARAAWGGFVIAFVVMFLFRRRESSGAGRGHILIAAAVLVPILILLDPSIVTTVTNRLAGGGLSANERTLQQQSLSLLAASAPWHGLGLSAAGHVGPLGQISYGYTGNNVASNWILGWWVDGKYLALPIMAVLIGTMAITIRRVGGVLLLLVLFSSLYSNAVVEPILWFTVGIALGDLPPRLAKPSLVDDALSSDQRALVSV